MTCFVGVFFLGIQAKATAELGPAAEEGNLATVQDCLRRGADIDVQGTVSFYLIFRVNTFGCILDGEVRSRVFFFELEYFHISLYSRASTTQFNVP